MTNHDDGEDDPQLRALRTVWLSMPDEEPPERGLADLMAAARAKAEELAQPSWWQRTLAMLRRPAVLALATVTVLISGALVIGRRAGTKEAEPAAEQLQRDRASSPGSGVVAPADNVAPGVVDATISAPEAPAPTPEPAAEREAPRVEHKAPPPQRAAPPPQRAAPPPRPAQKKQAAAEDLDSRYDEAAESSRLEGGDGVGQGNAQAAAPAAQPPATPVARYYAQARSAAARGDCAAARILAKRISKQDAEYYRSTVLADATLKKCL